MIRLVAQIGSATIWHIDGEYYVYGVTLGGDPRIAHSEGAAREIAAAVLA